MQLLRAIATVGGWTIASRIVGFARDAGMAGVMGAGLVTDAFLVAFQFPNLFRKLFAEGAFNTAFVPLFAGALEGEGEKGAKRFAEETLALMLPVLLIFTVVMIIFMPWVVQVIAPGFVQDPEKMRLTVDFTRLTFPYLMFMSLTAMFGGILNALHRFVAAAAAPILLNVFLLLALLLSYKGVFPNVGLTQSWAVALAGIGQFLWLCRSAARVGFLPRLRRPRATPEMRRLWKLMVPGALGAGVYQINVLVGTALATLLPQGSVSWLYYADRLTQFPLGVVGAAVAVALLPLLAKQVKSGDTAGATDSQNRALEFALLLTVPATVGLIAIPYQIVEVLFQRGEFGSADTVQTAYALAAFALGLPAFVLVKAFGPGYYARQDTVTPVKIAGLTLLVNIILAYGLMRVMGHAGIALATSITAWLNAFLLGGILHRRGYFVVDIRLKRFMPRLSISVVIMGVALWLGARALAEPFNGDLKHQVVALGILCGGGFLLFITLIQITGAVKLTDLKTAFRRTPPIVKP